jgi:hypothetical protein
MRFASLALYVAGTLGTGLPLLGFSAAPATLTKVNLVATEVGGGIEEMGIFVGR